MSTSAQQYIWVTTHQTWSWSTFGCCIICCIAFALGCVDKCLSIIAPFCYNVTNIVSLLIMAVIAYRRSLLSRVCSFTHQLVFVSILRSGFEYFFCASICTQRPLCVHIYEQHKLNILFISDHLSVHLNQSIRLLKSNRHRVHRVPASVLCPITEHRLCRKC